MACRVLSLAFQNQRRARNHKRVSTAFLPVQPSFNKNRTSTNVHSLAHQVAHWIHTSAALHHASYKPSYPPPVYLPFLVPPCPHNYLSPFTVRTSQFQGVSTPTSCHRVSSFSTSPHDLAATCSRAALAAFSLMWWPANEEAAGCDSKSRLKLGGCLYRKEVRDN